MTNDIALASRIRATIRDVPDFPKPGILFKDITPVLADPALMTAIVDAMSAPFANGSITHVVGIESRGFIFGAPIALHLGVAFVPVRKPGKLPWTTAREAYALEYGENVLEIHSDALGQGARVLIVDDVLATGGTAAATARLIRRLDGRVEGLAVLTELEFLNGRAALDAIAVHSLVTY